MKVYAIGDIHGQLDMLRAAHERIAADRDLNGDSDAPVIHLGDYTDRGPDSAGVLNFLIAGKENGEPWRFLLGNHDRMFRYYLSETPMRDPILKQQFTWMHPRLGGAETLRSYEIDTKLSENELHALSRRTVPDSHRHFLENLELLIETEDFLFVHAGIRPGRKLDNQSEDDLIWIRDEFHVDQKNHGKIVVHGHTPVEQATHYGNRINLDTGAGYGQPLSVAVFESNRCWILSENGRIPLISPNEL